MVWRLGSEAVGSWLNGSFSFWRNGGSRSPQCLPLSVDQSMPHWLNPTRLSFWPASSSLGSSGLKVIVSSAWRRKLQSWLTRLFPLLSRPGHPRDPGPEPRSAVGRSCPVPAASAASSRSSPAEMPSACWAATTVPADRKGRVRVTVTSWPSFCTFIFSTAAFSCPLAARFAMPSSPDARANTAQPSAVAPAASSPSTVILPRMRMFPLPCLAAVVGRVRADRPWSRWGRRIKPLHR